jgi:putative intracellular protease/amidase
MARTICGLSAMLAKAGLLKDKKFTTSEPVEEFEDFADGVYIDSNVIVDGNIVTAKGNGYVDFALTLGKVMDIYEDEKDYEETVRYFREFVG